MVWPDLCTALDLTKTPSELLTEDLIGKELDTEELWDNFYKLYSKHIGFSYRKDSTRKEKDGDRCGRRWCCSRQGFGRQKWLDLEHRSRAAAAETRCGCEASIRVVRSKTSNKWVCRHFNPNHNHECASPQEIRFLRSNRIVTDDVVARCESMKRAGMKNVQIIDFITLELGGHDKLPFLEKDIHNKLMRVRKARDHHQNITDSDGMIGYIRCLARNHGGDFYCAYNADEENRLANIIWSDGVSRRDYAVFGDVLAFNTTYRTNKYHKPYLLLVGVNNHWRTTVFGIALLVDETVDAFVWVLEMFLQGMNNRKPKVVITDGDNVMKNAIAQVFPESKHRLCGWHLMENVANNVKDINFKRDFKEIMYGYYSEPEFLDRWHSLILAYELENNYWATCMFEKRESWAETYLRGNFCAGMRITQRSESMNRTIRQLLDSTKSLTDFVSLIDHAINKLCHKDLQDGFSTRHSTPSLRRADILNPYYQHAAALFTRRIYTKKVSHEIKLIYVYTVRQVDEIDGYINFSIIKFPNGDSEHNVIRRISDGHLTCNCLLFETDGYPCRHIFSVLKFLNITRIPDSLVLSRWTVHAKAQFQTRYQTINEVPQEILELTRFGTLSSDFNQVAYYATKVEDFYQQTRAELANLCLKFKSVMEVEPPLARRQESIDEIIPFEVLKDPIIVRNKGTARRPQVGQTAHEELGLERLRRKCALCKGHGHNKQTCPLKKDKAKTMLTCSEWNDDTVDPTQMSSENICSSQQCYRPQINTEHAGFTISFGQQSDSLLSTSKSRTLLL